MNVLTRTLRHLTMKECHQIAHFRQVCINAIRYPESPLYAIREVSIQPAIIQEWYGEWLRDDHYPLSPVNKDHADDLWLKFCEEVGR